MQPILYERHRILHLFRLMELSKSGLYKMN